MRHLLLAAGALAALGTVALACGSFSSSDGATDGGAPESGPSDGAGLEAAPPGACAPSSAAADVARTRSAASNLQANGQDIFWIEGGTRVVHTSLSDCSTTEVAQGNITALAVDSHWVVWEDGQIHFVERNRLNQPPTIAPTSASSKAILGGNTLFWLDPGAISACAMPCVSTTVANTIGAPTELTANGSFLFYFATDEDAGAPGALFRQPVVLEGTNVVVGPLVTNQDPVALATNTAAVFWLNANGQVAGIPAGGGQPINLPKVPGAVALAADGAFVYVATSSAIGRVPVSGGDLAPLVRDESGITMLAVTDDSVVWGAAGAIRRIRKN